MALNNVPQDSNQESFLLPLSHYSIVNPPASFVRYKKIHKIHCFFNISASTTAWLPSSLITCNLFLPAFSVSTPELFSLFLHSWPNLLRTKMFLPLICLKPCNDFPLHAELSSNSLQLSTRLWDDPCLPLLNFTSHISSPYSYASATLPYSLLLEHTRTVPASWFWHLIFSLPGILFMW